MAAIPGRLRRLVIQHADNRCEYCGLAQEGQLATFHIDHVIPVAAGGETTADNLALASVSCSLRKGARQTVTDLVTNQEVSIFNPRIDEWHTHFYWENVYLVGRTPKGRATVDALALNRPAALLIRGEESYWGRHPYP
jgi:hypothetical protein